MKKLPFFTISCLLLMSCFISLPQRVTAQHDLSLMAGFDYGIPVNSYDQGKNVLYGTVPSRQFNMNTGIRYRAFDRIGIEGGIGQSIRTMRLGDNQFETESGNFNAVIKSKNHYLTGYVGLQGYVPVGDGAFLVIGGGVNWNNAGNSTLHSDATYVKGNESLNIQNAYQGSNRSFYGEFGYLGSPAGRSSMYIGAKVNIGESALMQGHYTATNNTSGTSYTDNVTDKGTFIGMNLKYYFRVMRKERELKDKHTKRLHRVKKPDPVVLHPVKPVEPIMQLEGRDVKIDDNIKAMGAEITISVWDSQAEDGDTVSVYLNGQLLKGNIPLKNAKYEFKAKLDPGKNYLVLYAHNLGKYPPNTAAIIVDDGVKKHQVVVESTLKMSGSVEITLGQ